MGHQGKIIAIDIKRTTLYYFYVPNSPSYKYCNFLVENARELLVVFLPHEEENIIWIKGVKISCLNKIKWRPSDNIVSQSSSC